MTFTGSALPPDAGLAQNECWPSNIAKQDPGFAVVTYDGYYVDNGRKPQWNYAADYDPNDNNGDP